jgi:negative regulator of flagellin synthesis FlgM
MKIDNLTQTQQSGAKPVKDSGPAEKVAQQEVRKQQEVPQETTDKVELSSVAQDLKMAADIAKATPEVRTEKVAALKEQVESGRYEVDSKKVASKMIVDSLSRLT